LEFAEQCGIAFQLTNILRDVGEDAAAGRVYLPAAELKHFGVAAAELRAVQVSPALRALLRFEAARAAEYYARSRPLLALVDPDSRASLWALVEIYRRLLERIEARDYEVLATRVRLPGWEKAAIALKAWTSGGRV
jgi:phytoene synthase